MLNPSNADQFKPDKTVTNIKKITIENGYNAFAIVNLFSYRTGSPKKLIDKFSKKDYLNDKNWETLSNKLNGNVVLAWSSNAKSICNKFEKDYYNEVLKKLIDNKCSLYVYDLNKDNTPRHPGPLSFNRVKNIKLKRIIVTFPLNLEGNKRNKQAETAIEKTKKYNENIDIIYLNKIIENLPPKSIYKDIFLIANEMIEKKVIKFINE